MKPTIHIHERPIYDRIRHNGRDLDGRRIGDGLPGEIVVCRGTEKTITIERGRVCEEWEEFPDSCVLVRVTRIVDDDGSATIERNYIWET